MKNKKWIIALIIGLVAVAITLVVLFVVLLFNGKSLKKYFIFEIKTKTKVILNEKYQSNNIKIITTSSDIDFKYSDDEEIKVVVYGEDKKYVKINETKDLLLINFDNNKKHFIGINFINNKIEVYIPKNYDKNVSIESDLGDIKAVDLKNSNINIDSDCGDIKLGSVKNTVIESDLGDVKVKKVLESINAKLDCGDLKIDSANLIKNSKIESDLGNVKIEKINDVYVDANTEMGETDVSSSNRYSDVTLKIELEAGDIKVK